MKSAWVSAAVVVIATAGWAVAQAPTPSAIQKTAGSDAVPLVMPAPDHAAGPVAVGDLFPDAPDNGPPPYKFWGSADFLVWKFRNFALPAVAHSVPVGVVEIDTIDRFVSSTGITDQTTHNFTPLSIQSASAFPDGGKVDPGEQFGGRFTVGVWFDPQQSFGLETTFFYIVPRNTGFNNTVNNDANAQGNIFFPFNNQLFFVTGTPPNQTRTLFQTLPAFAVRQATSDVSGSGSTQMWGAEVNARSTSASLGAVSGLVGLRYLDFHETLGLTDSFRVFLPPGDQDVNGFGGPLSPNMSLPTNLSSSTVDSIGTHNEFYGGQIGMELDMYIGHFTIDFLAKAALGVMHEEVSVFGTTTSSNGGVAVGGLLSSAADVGSHSRNQIAFVPEINLKLGYMILPSVRAYVGYDFLYLSSIVRPGEQTGIETTSIQANVNGTPNQIIRVSQPGFRFKESDMTINGINFGVEVRF